MTTTIQINKPANESVRFGMELISSLARNINATAFEASERIDGSCLVTDLESNIVIIISEMEDRFVLNIQGHGRNIKNRVETFARLYQVPKADLFCWQATLTIQAEQFLNRLDLTPPRA